MTRLAENRAGHIMVGSFQRSHDHDNLYLVGCAMFATDGTANPTLAMATLALRTAERIAIRV